MTASVMQSELRSALEKTRTVAEEQALRITVLTDERSRMIQEQTAQRRTWEETEQAWTSKMALIVQQREDDRLKNMEQQQQQREQITIEELMSQSKSNSNAGTTSHASGRGYSTPANTRENRHASSRNTRSPASGGTQSNRTVRHDRREEELKQEAMAECTFQPKITKLPASYGAARSYVKEDFHRID